MDWLGVFTLLTFTLGVCDGQPMECGQIGGMMQNPLNWILRTAGGRIFVAAFLENTFSADAPVYEILVTGTLRSTTVTISMNDADFKKKIQVGKGETATVELPNSMENKGSGIYSHGIIIKADADITVMTRNFKKTSGDVALIYPVDQWGKEYHIITPINGPSKHYAQFGVLAHEMPTTVTILPSTAIQYNGKNYQKGDRMVVKLEPFHLLQIQSKDDLSGTMISSDHTVTVMSGHSCAPSNGGCSHIYDYLRDKEKWGNSYFVPGLSFQGANDLVFISGSQKTCIQHKSGEKIINSNVEAGKIMTLNVSASSPLSIHSTEKIQVLFHGTGGTFKGKPFGPFMTVIPDIESFDLTYNLIGQKDIDNNLAIIVAKTSKGPEITFNGKTLKDATWKAFPQSEYSWAEYNYGGGSSSNTLHHSSTPFGLLNIGYSMNKAYGSQAAAIQAPGGPLCKSHVLKASFKTIIAHGPAKALEKGTLEAKKVLITVPPKASEKSTMKATFRDEDDD
ncbi:IgGFc-binding protein-like [Eleutherodactylus coqui]|uniref:IgGFc-binding protein-like n=1 Tax=Eleutherodactylus coqui TaxID=57060 RepID=UPI003461B10A